MKMAATVNDRVRDGTTAQGFYVVGADGSGYGFNNNRDPQRVDRFMSRGIEQFREHPPANTDVPESIRTAPFSRAPDPSTSVIRVFSRIRPLPPGADVLNAGVGRDHLWILAGEVREILSAGNKVGRAFAMPSTLVARLVRFHLVDNVRGEPDMWAPDEVGKAAFTAWLTEKTPTTGTFTFSGTFAQQTADGRRGGEGKIEGVFDVDPRTAKIVRFRAYSEGEAWGAGHFTGNAPQGRFPLVIAMVEAADSVAKAVPPQGILWGEQYFTSRLSPAPSKER
jgi:hypothetical protein